jgi:hypothetical protein
MKHAVAQPLASADVQVRVGDVKNDASVTGVDFGHPRSGADAR